MIDKPRQHKISKWSCNMHIIHYKNVPFFKLRELLKLFNHISSHLIFLIFSLEII